MATKPFRLPAFNSSDRQLQVLRRPSDGCPHHDERFAQECIRLHKRHDEYLDWLRRWGDDHSSAASKTPENALLGMRYLVYGDQATGPVLGAFGIAKQDYMLSDNPSCLTGFYWVGDFITLVLDNALRENLSLYWQWYNGLRRLMLNRRDRDCQTYANTTQTEITANLWFGTEWDSRALLQRASFGSVYSKRPPSFENEVRELGFRSVAEVQTTSGLFPVYSKTWLPKKPT